MPALDRDQARVLAGALAAGRIAIGVSAYLMPELPGRIWVGDVARSPGGHVLARTLGIRDLALGLGAALALRRGGPARGWIEAGGLADAGDVVATLIAFPRLPKWGRLLVLGAAGGAVAAAALAAPHVDV